jgi:hypothetical protein
VTKQDQLLEALSEATALVRELSAKLNDEREADDRLVIAPGQEWANTAQVARRFGVRQPWVRAHGRELGGARGDDCAHGELRYHVATADAFWEGRMLKPRRPARPGRARRAAAGRRGAAGVPRLDFV